MKIAFCDYAGKEYQPDAVMTPADEMNGTAASLTLLAVTLKTQMPPGTANFGLSRQTGAPNRWQTS
jgi:hypothetical protein